MRKIHYNRERAKLEAEEQAVQTNLDQIRRKIEALELVWNEIFSGTNGETRRRARIRPDDQSVAEAAPVANARERISHGQIANNGKVGKAIEAVTTEFAKEFGVKEVMTAVLANYPQLALERTTVAGKLKKMAEDGKLEIVVQGIGRRPSSFRRKA